MMMDWMKKWWWLTVVILAVALVIGWKEKSCQSHAYQCSTNYAAQLPAGLKIQEQASEQEAITAACEPNSYFCRFFSPANLPSVLLVLIGIAAFYAAMKSLRIIERQTQAVETQAKAMMDADAAFLIIVWDNFVHLNPETREQGRLGHALNWTVRNIGKTPAFVKEVACRFIPISSFGDLPLDPQYPSPRDLQTEIEPLLAGGTLERWIYATLETTLSFDEIDKKVRKKDFLLYGFGYVKYLDIYGREQETRFGLVYECRPVPTKAEDRLVMAGPKSYNRYTAFQKKK